MTTLSTTQKERIERIASEHMGKPLTESDAVAHEACIAALTAYAKEEQRERELLIEFATNACGELAENAARDLDHYGKNHSKWYKAVKRVRVLLNIKTS